MSEIIAEMRLLQSVEGQPPRSTCRELGTPSESSVLKRYKQCLARNPMAEILSVPGSSVCMGSLRGASLLPCSMH